MRPIKPETHYIDEKNLCVHGHTPTRRYISTGMCIDCAKAQRDLITPEKRAAYRKVMREGKKRDYPSVHQVLITTLEAQLQFLQFDLTDCTSDKANEQVKLIQKALAHKSGAKWVV